MLTAASGGQFDHPEARGEGHFGVAIAYGNAQHDGRAASVCGGYLEQRPDRAGENGAVVMSIRHRHAGAKVNKWFRDGDRIRVELAEPVDGAAPGQGLVLYEGDMVLGGARITLDNR